jgi:zinc protease
MIAVARLLAFGAVAAGLITSAPASAKLFDPTTFTLPNGLQVVVLSNMRAPVVHQMVWYHVGAADEPMGKSGIAHYLEHLMFKGTKSVKPDEFAHIIALQGGEHNAFTDHDYTGYYVTVSSDRLPLVMKLEADRMQNVQFSDPVAKPELQVVREERRMRTDNSPASQLRELTMAALYLNHPYRLPVIGWDGEINKLDYRDAAQFYRTWYAPNNATLIVAGAVTVEQVKKLAEQNFGPIPSRPVPARVRAIEPPHLAASRVEMVSDRVHEPSWSRHYLVPSYKSASDPAEPYAIQILAEILGASSVSRLDRALVLGENKVASGVSASYDGDAFDLGTFVLAGTPKKGGSVAELEAAIDAQVRTLLDKGVTEEEVERARTHLQESSVFARDSLSQGAQEIGRALSIGMKIEDVENWPDRIAKVTAAQVNAAAHDVLKLENSVTSILKPAPQS